jgi:hypothetical protein
MGWLSRIFAGGVGKVIGQVGGIIDQFKLSPEEKQKITIEMESLLQKRDSEIEQTIRAELGAKERVLVAELVQGDNYTKRARPTVVYAGLAFIFFNYCVVPTIQSLTGAEVEAFKLPREFWAGWAGIVATWSIGRSAEKRGARNRLTSAITGNGHSRLMDDDSVQG